MLGLCACIPLWSTMQHSWEPRSAGSHLVSHPSHSSKYIPDKLTWTHIHLATVQGHDQADTLRLLAPTAILSLFSIGVRQLAPPMYCTGFFTGVHLMLAPWRLAHPAAANFAVQRAMAFHAITCRDHQCFLCMRAAHPAAVWQANSHHGPCLLPIMPRVPRSQAYRQAHAVHASAT
jgi:hypothetical protein